MEYKYLITDIQAKAKVSITSLTTFKNKHKDFFNNNSTRIRRKIYYNQAAMDFFLSYYQPEQQTETKENPRIEKPNGEEGQESKESPYIKPNGEEGQENQENPRIEANGEEVREESQTSAMKAEIDTLKAEIDALRKQLDAKEEERKELLRQNGALILTISQLQQEKLLLLPAPKKTISERVKGLFHKQE